MPSVNLTVALAGNPNSGKTTIFNNITGSHQHVGNYPGVTVERREGFRRFEDKDLLLIDLPGTYSLTAHSLDEVVARSVIIDEKPDIIVNILDASNLERNLYLAVQLLELGRPVVLALNMTDVAEEMGLEVDESLLGHKLGTPIVRMIGNRNQGTEKLLKMVTTVAVEGHQQPFILNYGSEIELHIKHIIDALALLTEVKFPRRWLAIKLLEGDQDVNSAITLMPEGAAVLALVQKTWINLKTIVGDDLAIVIAECRYHFVSTVYREIVLTQSHQPQTTSDKIDHLLTHRIWGLPLFFAIMWLLFNIVFTIGAYPQEWIETGIGLLSDFVAEYMTDGDLKSLVIDGVFGGVGSVVSFLPNILLLFLGIALLEDTGYMARCAFVMDRVMRAVGLHGKSFIPLLIGFGCTVPAIMGTRTLENPRDRMVTILVSPLMSCSARLPVYLLLTSAFFQKYIAGTVMFSIYLLGILLAFTLAMFFRKTLFPGAAEPFVMEMPPYHFPTLRSILTHMWERSALYLKKAGTLILVASILVWFITNYPSEVPNGINFEQAKNQIEEYHDLEQQQGAMAQLEKEHAAEKLANSYAGRFGQLIEPAIRPLGFDWKIGVGLVSAVAAKEVLISTLGTIYSVGQAEDESTALQDALLGDPVFTPLVAYTLMVFTLIYSPCLAALAVIRRETNSWKWTFFTFGYSTVLAWILAFTTYQVGTLLGF